MKPNASFQPVPDTISQSAADIQFLNGIEYSKLFQNYLKLFKCTGIRLPSIIQWKVRVQNVIKLRKLVVFTPKFEVFIEKLRFLGIFRLMEILIFQIIWCSKLNNCFNSAGYHSTWIILVRSSALDLGTEWDNPVNICLRFRTVTNSFKVFQFIRRYLTR